MAIHRVRKRFGQHFLHDDQVIQRLLIAIDPKPGQHLIEIGPGRGVLTVPLLTAVGELDAVELDRDLVTDLQTRLAGSGLHLHAADALAFNFAALRTDNRPLRIVGNLPYNISTPLLFPLLAQADDIADMHFMLQKEVVQRMAAAPGGGDYGRLSVMVQTACRVECLFTVAAQAFHPPPKVDSAVVRLVPYIRPPVAIHDQAQFTQLVAQAFSQRRKTLRNSLRGGLDASAIQAAGIDPSARPEILSPEDFAALSNYVSKRQANP